jgi:pimeloyl-ACP methyl ester carboxylesterase
MNWKTNGRLTVDGIGLEYICLGPAPDEAPTLVMLHEGLGSVELWRDVPQLLADSTGCGIFAYSRAGYGRSDAVPLPRPLDYMHREASDVLPDVLNQMGIQQAILMGHSDGATIAALYAGGSGDMRVRGQILIAPHFFHEPDGRAAIAEARKAFMDGKLREKLSKYHDHVDVAFLGWADSWLDPSSDDWNDADVIDYFRTPTLCIQGDADPYGTMLQIEEVSNRSYAPVDELRLPGIGHAPHIEAQEETLASITEFCKRLQRIEAEEVAI